MIFFTHEYERAMRFYIRSLAVDDRVFYDIRVIRIETADSYGFAAKIQVSIAGAGVGPVGELDASRNVQLVGNLAADKSPNTIQGS